MVKVALVTAEALYRVTGMPLPASFGTLMTLVVVGLSGPREKSGRPRTFVLPVW